MTAEIPFAVTRAEDVASMNTGQAAAELQGMVDTLRHLARHCHGDDRPDCPILNDLADGRAAEGARARPSTKLTGRPRPAAVRA